MEHIDGYLMLYITGLIQLWIVIRMKKHYTKLVLYGNFLFAIVFEVVFDLYIDIKLNWYGYFHPEADWGFLPLIFLLFGCFNVIYSNFLPRTRKERLLYITGAVLFCAMYEYLFYQLTGDIYYNQWRYYHSLISYPFIFLILTGHHVVLVKMGQKDG